MTAFPFPLIIYVTLCMMWEMALYDWPTPPNKIMGKITFDVRPLSSVQSAIHANALWDSEFITRTKMWLFGP